MERREAYSIDALQKRIAENIKRHLAAALHASVPTLFVVRKGKGQVLLLNHVLGIADSDLEFGQIVQLHVDGEGVALLEPVVGRAGDLVVDLLDHLVRHERERGSRVGDGRVAVEIDLLAVDGARLGRDRPEALRVVDVGPVDVLARLLDQVLVDEAERVEGLVVLVARAVEGRREEFRLLGDVLLLDHVLDGRRLRVRLAGRVRDRVDLAPREAQEAVTSALGELLRHFGGALDGLFLDN